MLKLQLQTETVRRLITALLLAPLLPLLALFMSDWLLLVWGLVWLLCLYEWCLMYGASVLVRYVCCLLFILIVAAMAWWQPLGVVEVMLWISAVSWLLVPVLLSGSYWPVRPVSRLLLGLAVVLPAYVSVIVLYRQPWAFIYMLLLVWMADSAAWFCGRRWGRHKLAPAISAGKTVEGLAGAVVGVNVLVLLWFFVVNAAFAGTVFLPFFHLWWVSMLLLAVALFGDLLESRAKRVAGCKDSGGLLPGHGGFFDRMDSMAAVAPVFACCLGLLR